MLIWLLTTAFPSGLEDVSLSNLFGFLCQLLGNILV